MRIRCVTLVAAALATVCLCEDADTSIDELVKMLMQERYAELTNAHPALARTVLTGRQTVPAVDTAEDEIIMALGPAGPAAAPGSPEHVTPRPNPRASPRAMPIHTVPHHLKDVAKKELVPEWRSLKTTMAPSNAHRTTDKIVVPIESAEESIEDYGTDSDYELGHKKATRLPPKRRFTTSIRRALPLPSEQMTVEKEMREKEKRIAEFFEEELIAKPQTTTTTTTTTTTPPTASSSESDEFQDARKVQVQAAMALEETPDVSAAQGEFEYDLPSETVDGLRNPVMQSVVERIKNQETTTEATTTEATTTLPTPPPTTRPRPSPPTAPLRIVQRPLSQSRPVHPTHSAFGPPLDIEREAALPNNPLVVIRTTPAPVATPSVEEVEHFLATLKPQAPVPPPTTQAPTTTADLQTISPVHIVRMPSMPSIRPRRRPSTSTMPTNSIEEDEQLQNELDNFAVKTVEAEQAVTIAPSIAIVPLAFDHDPFEEAQTTTMETTTEQTTTWAPETTSQDTTTVETTWEPQTLAVETTIVPDTTPADYDYETTVVFEEVPDTTTVAAETTWVAETTTEEVTRPAATIDSDTFTRATQRPVPLVDREAGELTQPPLDRDLVDRAMQFIHTSSTPKKRTKAPRRTTPTPTTTEETTTEMTTTEMWTTEEQTTTEEPTTTEAPLIPMKRASKKVKKTTAQKMKFKKGSDRMMLGAATLVDEEEDRFEGGSQIVPYPRYQAPLAVVPVEQPQQYVQPYPPQPIVVMQRPMYQQYAGPQMVAAPPAPRRAVVEVMTADQPVQVQPPPRPMVVYPQQPMVQQMQPMYAPQPMMQAAQPVMYQQPQYVQQAPQYMPQQQPFYSQPLYYINGKKKV